jgi:hypothetical protein
VARAAACVASCLRRPQQLQGLTLLLPPPLLSLLLRLLPAMLLLLPASSNTKNSCNTIMCFRQLRRGRHTFVYFHALPLCGIAGSWQCRYQPS